MNPDDILVLLPIKPEDMPKITTMTNKKIRASIKYFQESIQYQAMAITNCDQNLGFLGMVFWASGFDPINHGNPFVTPTYPVPAPVNAIGTDSKITEVVCLYKDDKEKFNTYCGFFIILISMITNKYP